MTKKNEGLAFQMAMIIVKCIVYVETLHYAILTKTFQIMALMGSTRKENLSYIKQSHHYGTNLSNTSNHSKDKLELNGLLLDIRDFFLRELLIERDVTSLILKEQNLKSESSSEKYVLRQVAVNPVVLYTLQIDTDSSSEDSDKEDKSPNTSISKTEGNLDETEATASGNRKTSRTPRKKKGLSYRKTSKRTIAGSTKMDDSARNTKLDRKQKETSKESVTDSANENTKQMSSQSDHSIDEICSKTAESLKMITSVARSRSSTEGSEAESYDVREMHRPNSGSQNINMGEEIDYAASVASNSSELKVTVTPDSRDSEVEYLKTRGNSPEREPIAIITISDESTDVTVPVEPVEEIVLPPPRERIDVIGQNPMLSELLSKPIPIPNYAMLPRDENAERELDQVLKVAETMQGILNSANQRATISMNENYDFIIDLLPDDPQKGTCPEKDDEHSDPEGRTRLSKKMSNERSRKISSSSDSQTDNLAVSSTSGAQTDCLAVPSTSGAQTDSLAVPSTSDAQTDSLAVPLTSNIESADLLTAHPTRVESADNLFVVPTTNASSTIRPSTSSRKKGGAIPKVARISRKRLSESSPDESGFKEPFPPNEYGSEAKQRKSDSCKSDTSEDGSPLKRAKVLSREREKHPNQASGHSPNIIYPPKKRYVEEMYKREFTLPAACSENPQNDEITQQQTVPSNEEEQSEALDLSFSYDPKSSDEEPESLEKKKKKLSVQTDKNDARLKIPKERKRVMRTALIFDSSAEILVNCHCCKFEQIYAGLRFYLL